MKPRELLKGGKKTGHDPQGFRLVPKSAGRAVAH